MFKLLLVLLGWALQASAEFFDSKAYVGSDWSNLPTAVL